MVSDIIQRTALLLWKRVQSLPLEDRARPLRMNLNAKTTPELYKGSAAEARLAWDLLEQAFVHSGIVQLVVGVQHSLEEHPLYRKPAFILCEDQIGAVKYLAGIDDAPAFSDRVAATWLSHYPVHRDIATVIKLSIPNSWQQLSDIDIVKGIELLRSLPRDGTVLLREASAQCFLGLSKLLDGRSQFVANLLGMTDCPFPESPLHIQIHIPTIPRAVLLVENLTTFERAVREVGLAPLALVYAQGYKVSATRIRANTRIFASRDTATDARDWFEKWFQTGGDSMPCFFWGDLDFAGMDILRRLRAVFPGMQAWQPGYMAMLDCLERHHSHPPEAADKNLQNDPLNTGCEYADNVLLQALRRHGRVVDQEAVLFSGLMVT
jgi:hypothetical protein